MFTPSSQSGGPPPGAGLEERVATLETALAAVLERVAVLEAGAPLALPAAASPEVPAVLVEPPPALPSGVHIMGLVGKVCLILGGGYFIRMLAEAGRLPNALSVALGLAYAVTWALIALRDKQSLVATFDALASILIAYPLLVESTVRFKWLAPETTAPLLLAVTVLHTVVAWRRDLQPMVWMATLGALGSALVMMAATHALEPFLAVLLVLGLAALWLTYDRRWQGLRWPTALSANLGMVVLAYLAGWTGGPPEGYQHLSAARGIGFALALAAGYLGSFAWRLLAQRRTAGAFERAQTILVLLVGFGGALRLAAAAGSGAGLLGIGAALAGAGCYAAASPFARDEAETGRNFAYFTLLAMLLLLLGGGMVVPLPVFAVLAGLAGLAAMAATLRLQRLVLLFQSAVYLAVAGGGSGLFPWTFRVFLDPSGPGAAPVLAAVLVLALLAGAVGAFLARSPDPAFSLRVRPLALLLGGLTVLGLGAVVVWAVAPLKASSPGELARLAVVRTGVLTTLTVGLAWSARRIPALDLRWLVYPFLALATIKFLFEDMGVGQPLTLFLAFMFLGTTFILAPRLLKVNP